MSGSALTPFNFIPENSLATPGLWNSVFSTLSQNIAEANTISSVLSGGISLGTQGLTINVPSNVTDYIFLNDSANLRSSYVIGSNAGGTADGLNIFDASGNTMLVSFSKQSIRFFQQVVGPVFDVGGALASTLNAATFGGSEKTVQIQAAISAASLAGIKRVYVPASMYPYKSNKITFETSVQMVREGGDWAVYDVFAYGALGLGTDAASIQAAANAASANNGICYFPPGTYNVDTSITLNAAADVQFVGPGGNSALVSMAASGVTLLRFTGVCSRIGIRGLWLGSFVSYAAGGSIGVVGTTGTHSDTIVIEDVTVQNTPYPIVLECVDRSTLRTVKVINTIAGAIVGPALSLRTVISTVFDNFQASFSVVSYPSDIVDMSHDCDTLSMVNCEVLGATGSGFRCRNPAGSTGPRLIRFTNCLSESHTSAGFSIEAGRDIRLAQCEASLSSTGYAISGATSTTITNCLAYSNNYWGFNVLPGAADVQIASCGATNNSQAANNTYDGIHVESNVTTGVIIANNRSGDFILPGASNKQRYGLSIYTSTDSLIIMGNDLRQNSTGAFLNLSTGVKNLIVDSSNITTSSAQSLNLVAGTITASVISSTVASGYNVGMKVSNGNRLVTGVNGGSYLLEVGSVFIADGDGGANKGKLYVNSGIVSEPSLSFTQEQALGFWRSGASRVGLTYGQFSLPVGSTTTPALGYSSESSLGWYRSAASVMALSYGGLGVRNGTNASFGTAALGSNGSVNVATTYVAAGDVIFLTDQTAGGTLGDIELGGIRAGSGFTIQSTSVTDTSTVGWLIVRAAV